MIAKEAKRKIKNRKKKRKRKRNENENLLEMAAKRNQRRRRKKRFLVNQREIFHRTSFTSEKIVRKSSQIMLVSVSLK